MGRREVAMMFVSDPMRLVLLTRHLPLRAVAAAVDCREALATMGVAVAALRRWFGVARPRLAVCGLNPHAGEAGLFGDEEQRVLVPAMRALRRRGVACDGPLAADGFFAQPALVATYDAVVCWYHDQGLIPFKMASRDRGCQLTVGLPIPRTSPDHGTALEIAGQGIADPGSMRYALALAIRLAHADRA
jgi:4-hydroxythreonine-4-phosphate dehydrogenase